MKTTKNIILTSVVFMTFVIFTFEIVFGLYIQQKESLLLNKSILINTVVKEADIITQQIQQISQNARVLALLIGSDGAQETNIYDQFIRDTISEVVFAFGMGYWFEPYDFDKRIEYYGPYIYKDNDGALVKTMEYSNKAYDYFSHDWYSKTLESEDVIFYSDPFYDEYLDTVFMTAGVKIYREKEKIGVVSIDITLREVNQHLKSIRQSDKASAFIITDAGQFWGNSEGLDLDLDDNILNSENEELKNLGALILKSNTSDSVILDENIYVWSSIGDTNLKLIMGYPKSNIIYPLYRRVALNILLFVLAMVIFIFFLNIILVQRIEKPLIDLINHNLTEAQEIVIKKIGFDNKGPNFDSMIKLIQRLLSERQDHIHKLNDNNKELSKKNDEIEALYHQTEAMNKELYELLDAVHNGYIVTVRSLSNAIEAKDKYTQGHCENVTKYSLETAKILGLSEEDLVVLEYAALLHDVGKIGIPSSILNKPTRLSEEEFDIIKTHPTIGYEILKDIEFLKRSALIIYQHHERIDGKGYPRGLTKDELDILTRIITVTDAYDAMTSARPYRKEPLSHKEAMEILIEGSGTQFDGDIVDAFRKYKEESANL
ncbi:MAG TPA: HD domain-containing phosphohydrolase [Clostridia bacterium]|nr:HD domain-containing phosphohydrolase [Clostridia bacterium]